MHEVFVNGGRCTRIGSVAEDGCNLRVCVEVDLDFACEGLYTGEHIRLIPWPCWLRGR